ncbi:MAG: hypothetical protein JSU75_09920 [Gammaproteobacteria bacterium]|nr:MAG: hypothetical protein JSU75_09920 [Gammaproteobacteria bacterium]
MKNGSRISFSRVFVLVLVGTIGYTSLTANDDGTGNTRTANHYQDMQDGFDPNALPAPAAGLPGGSWAKAYNCKDMLYQTSKNGINYVREYGGIYSAAIINERFGMYRLNYGHLQEVDTRTVDPYTIRKLRYGLRKCNETYIRSGAHVLTRVTLSAS